MSTRQRTDHAVSHQRGSVLFVSLVILLILSSLAISTANTAIVENKMAAATRSQQLARFAADSATNEAKVRIVEAAAAGGAAAVCTQLRCLVRPGGSPDDPVEMMLTPSAHAAATAFRIDFTQLAGPDQSARLAASPSYVIEDLGNAADPTVSIHSHGPALRGFRITARGVGGTLDVVHVYETVFTVPI